MADPEQQFPASKNDSSPDKENTDKQGPYPELAEEFRRADIPVLDQQAAVDVLEDTIPALEETWAAFEKTVPVLEETIPGPGTDFKSVPSE